MTKWR